jgi:hypothetical protein
MATFHSSLSPQQLKTLARIRHARKHGFRPSQEDCDRLLAFINQLVANCTHLRSPQKRSMYRRQRYQCHGSKEGLNPSRNTFLRYF